MSRLHFILPAAAALALVVFIPTSAYALAQTQGSQVKVPHFSKSQQKATHLSPIVVYGHGLPFPIQLQLYKKALTRSWSTDPADLDKLVCRWVTATGTHFQHLRCETNRMHLKAYDKLQTAMLTTMAAGGTVSMELASLTLQKKIPRSTMVPLLKKLPPADSSYTLRVTDHGKPLIDYVIKDGELVKVLKYPQAEKGAH